LDALPGIADSGAIEIGSVPRFESVDGPSTTYSRIPSLQFPVDPAGNTPLFHNFTVYSKSALWNEVESWVQGSAPAKGIFNAKGAYLPKVTANPLVVQQGSEIQGVGKWVATAALDDHTFGLTWQKDGLSPWKPGVRKGEFPSYFRKTGESWKQSRRGKCRTERDFHPPISRRLAGMDPTCLRRGARAFG
jgi:hypothetical protein